ncbi:MAG TPA: extracellular solute-binding protein [Xanthobacteraceae bacterium]|nr:extracellular solute-binding protein [Xanthobacteraceae bacterium]
MSFSAKSSFAMSRRALLILPWLFAAGSAMAQTAEDASAIYLYQGADRETRMVAKAREEGTLLLYTSMAPSESGQLGQAFEKKYGVKVQIWRNLSEAVLQRALSEAQAKRHSVDVVETNGPEIDALAKEGVVAEYFSPYVANLRPFAVAPQRKWISDRVNLFVVGYNTTKVKREEIPATYEGFLDPKWKGKLAIEATDQEWLGALIKYWGEKRGMEFFQKLAAQKPDLRKGHVLLAQLIAAGEIPVGLSAYSANMDSIKAKGGPVDWAAVEPLVGRPQGLAVAKYAPHPYAALLFADFVLSPEGMALLGAMGRVPTSKNVKTPLDSTKYIMLDVAAVNEEQDKWQKIWNELFLK